ncbi:hypothetical protein QN362_16995 [Actimicrobium sp. CCC2.4]|uniref:hypothetical protein n=1 Tax=Actimicrobium sp. CCC2.4 TaxID=3048606 RepID=UPI002AC9E072|nr:hypothetical protein [Actimicrobium sp. CCC2.4]MEB0137035.1 hypothetical protein [Actimicrobium sp. CCC2.4]WPX32228.1 hypothetical protein RHM62_18720 [Actimicrobium sp. CCC2.4]
MRTLVTGMTTSNKGKSGPAAEADEGSPSRDSPVNPERVSMDGQSIFSSSTGTPTGANHSPFSLRSEGPHLLTSHFLPQQSSNDGDNFERINSPLPSTANTESLSTETADSLTPPISTASTEEIHTQPILKTSGDVAGPISSGSDKKEKLDEIDRERGDDWDLIPKLPPEPETPEAPRSRLSVIAEQSEPEQSASSSRPDKGTGDTASRALPIPISHGTQPASDDTNSPTLGERITAAIAYVADCKGRVRDTLQLPSTRQIVSSQSSRQAPGVFAEIHTFNNHRDTLDQYLENLQADLQVLEQRNNSSSQGMSPIEIQAELTQILQYVDAALVKAQDRKEEVIALLNAASEQASEPEPATRPTVTTRPTAWQLQPLGSPASQATDVQDWVDKHASAAHGDAAGTRIPQAASSEKRPFDASATQPQTSAFDDPWQAGQSLAAVAAPHGTEASRDVAVRAVQGGLPGTQHFASPFVTQPEPAAAGILGASALPKLPTGRKPGIKERPKSTESISSENCYSMYEPEEDKQYWGMSAQLREKERNLSSLVKKQLMREFTPVNTVKHLPQAVKNLLTPMTFLLDEIELFREKKYDSTHSGREAAKPKIEVLIKKTDILESKLSAEAKKDFDVKQWVCSPRSIARDNRIRLHAVASSVLTDGLAHHAKKSHPGVINDKAGAALHRIELLVAELEKSDSGMLPEPDDARQPRKYNVGTTMFARKLELESKPARLKKMARKPELALREYATLNSMRKSNPKPAWR